MANLGCAMDASLKNNVAQVMSTESKIFRQRMQGDAAVAAEMRTSLEAEEAHQRERRVEFQAEMQQVRVKKRMDRELKDMQVQLEKGPQRASRGALRGGGEGQREVLPPLWHWGKVRRKAEVLNDRTRAMMCSSACAQSPI